jgi:multidrug efflux pump subunit AcrA (membrane-fusion protein)
MSKARHAGLWLYVALLWAGVGPFTSWSLPAANPAWGQQADQAQSDAGSTIRGHGIIVPTNCEEIRCEVAQPLPVLFMAPYGSTVKKGDLLVELDAFSLMDRSREQEIRLAKSRAALAAAEAAFPNDKKEASEAVAIAEQALALARRRLADYHVGEYPNLERVALNEVALAEERAIRLKTRSEELEAAHEQQGTESLEQELIEVRLASAQAQMAADVARDKAKLLKEIIRPQRTGELELAIAQRELDLLQAKNKVARISTQAEMEIRVAQMVNRMEEERLLLLVHQTKRSQVHAPRDGTVFSADDGVLGARCETEVRAGDTVRPRQVLLRLADLTQLKLDVRLSPAQARKLAPDHATTIRCDAFPDRVFHGRVTGTQALPDSDAADRRTGAIATVRLNDPVAGLRPGMTATAEFSLPSAR